MKRFSIIQRVTGTLAALAMIAGGTFLTACDDDDTIVEKPIQVTILPTPANVTNNVVTAAEASFTWDRVDGAYTYLAELKTDPNGSVSKQAVLDDPMHTVAFTELEDGMDYYFRVRACDRYSEGKNSYYSEWVKVTTDVIPPQYTPLATPQNVFCDALLTTTASLTFKWDVVENAASYVYKITPAGGQAVMGEVTGLSAKIDALSPPGTTYSFQVAAKPATTSTVYTSSAYSRSVNATTMGQLAVPVVAVGPATDVTDLYFIWTAVPNAGGYTYQISDDNITYGAEESVDAATTSVTISGLAPSTVKWIKVKATPLSGSTEYAASSYSAPLKGKTLAGIPLATPAPAQTAATYNTVTLTWAAVANAESYKYQAGSDEGTITDPTQTSITLTFATPAKAAETTSFTMQAIAVQGSTYDNSEWSASAPIAVTVPRTAISVTDATTLEAAIGEMNFGTGGKITLASGSYVYNSYSSTTSEYTPGSIKISKPIELVGPASGARPAINAKDIQITAAVDKFTLENIEYSGLEVNAATGVLAGDNSSSYGIDVQAAGLIGTLTIKNCYIHNLGNAVVRANRGTTSGVSNAVITGNLLYNIKGANGGVINAASKTVPAGSNWTIQNNTITGIGAYAYATATKQRVIQFPTGTTTFTAIVSNNTFYNIYSTDNSIDVGGTGDCGAIVVEKNIFQFNTTGTSKGPRLGSNAGSATRDNNVYSTWSGSSPADTGTTNVNPAFPDYTGATGVPANATFVPAAGVTQTWGDPRWVTP